MVYSTIVMDILLLILFSFLAVICMRGLFNREWHEAAQSKIDAIQRKRIFWQTLSGIEGSVFDIDAVFTIYLDPNWLPKLLLRGFGEENKDKEIKSLIRKRQGYKSINSINNALEARDEIITSIIAKNSFAFTKADIEKKFDEHEKESFSVPEQYDKFVSYFLNCLPDKSGLEKFSLTDVWVGRKKLEERVRGLEYKMGVRAEVRADSKTLFDLKKSQVEIGEVVLFIITEKTVNDKERSDIENALHDWEKLHMLHWCVVDYTVAWYGTNILQRGFWHFVE